jgi:phospholipid-binding lipoprotein MlaA
MKKINALKMISFVFILFHSCNVFAEDVTPPTSNIDPYETFNRPMFVFNDWLDRWILKPIAVVYSKVTPKPLSKGLSNAYNNIDTLPTLLNDILQGNFYQAINDSWRLGINTTIGIGGLFDVATAMGLEANNKQDFGLTLARWGWVNSNYLVLPILGPGTVRDQLSVYPNYYLTIYPYIEPDSLMYGVYAGSVIVKRAEILRYQNVFEQAALDKYTFVRDAYLQRRAYLIERNKQLSNPYLEKNNASAAESS